MKTVVLRRGCGIGFSNLPAVIFSYMIHPLIGCGIVEPGSISFNIDDAVAPEVKSALILFKPDISVLEQGNIIDVEGADLDIDDNYEINDAAPILPNTDGIVRVDATHMTAQAAQWRPDRIVGIDDTHITAQTARLDTRGIIDTATDVPQERMVPQELLVPRDQYKSVPSDQLSIFLAGKMKNDLSSRANLAKESVEELNKLMSKVVLLNNKINNYMRDLNGNEKISKIISEISGSLNQPYVEDVFVDETGWLNIKTENIITEILGDDTRRDIGKMLIRFNMNVIMNELGTMTDAKILEIYNLTHNACDEDEEQYYECGHVLRGSRICFGDGFPHLITALSNQDILMALMMVMKFIKNPNINDAWGVGATFFPEAV